MKASVHYYVSSSRHLATNICVKSALKCPSEQCHYDSNWKLRPCDGTAACKITVSIDHMSYELSLSLSFYYKILTQYIQPKIINGS